MKQWMRMAGTAGAAVLVVCVAANSFAQEGRGGGRGRGGFGGGGRGFGMGGFGQDAISLAGNEAVQKDLALSDEQKTKVEELMGSYREKRRESMQDLGFGGRGQGERPSAEERAERAEKMREANTKLSDEFRPKLEEIVGADHMKRLDEIALQAQGPQAFSDEKTAKALGITDEEKTKLADLNREYGEKIRDLFSGGPGEGMREKMQELSKEHMDAAMALLTQEQKDKFTEMKGKEFDVAELRPRGGFGGGRGPGGGGGGGRGGRGGRDGGSDRPERPATDDSN